MFCPILAHSAWVTASISPTNTIWGGFSGLA
jgi:hypothetical protein